MISNYIVTKNKPKSPVSEAYRVIRTNIQFSSIENPVKSFVVTSSVPGEGKSTTVANLAVTFAQSGNKVLLIDCDLRKPILHKFFGISNKEGLTNIIAGHGIFREYIQTTEIENLYLLPCGPIPPNPSEIIGSRFMKSLHAELIEQFDYVLFDSPPVGTVTDAQILSTIVDGVVLVVAVGTVSQQSFKRANELLRNVNANTLGVIMNKIDTNNDGYYYYYYYLNSSYYAPEGEVRGQADKKKSSKKHKY
jgi:capsular exopolysaccharide synthesis family protein